jgi:hypothetical protein
MRIQKIHGLPLMAVQFFHRDRLKFLPANHKKSCVLRTLDGCRAFQLRFTVTLHERQFAEHRAWDHSPNFFSNVVAVVVGVVAAIVAFIAVIT